jgi:high-affinity Fe2+/Pb2+ permease
MCIAAYLTLWTGASVAMSVATYLRPMLAILFFASALLLVVGAWQYERVKKSQWEGEASKGLSVTEGLESL